MLHVVRPAVFALTLTLLVACGGGDSPTSGIPPAAKRASLTVTIANLPPDAAVSVTVAGPNGFTQAVTSTTTITDLTPGSYTVSAASAETETALYAPLSPSQNVELTAGSARAAEVSYALASGTLDLDVVGLPAQSEASVTVTGPNNYSRQITADERLNKLAPGPYVISAASVMAGGDGYAASAMPRSIDLPASTAPYLVGIAYAIATGRLQVQANGLPSGATPSFQITGPNGYDQTAALGEVLLGLAPGTYTIATPNVSMGGSTYVPSTSTVTVAVVPSTTPAQANVAYALSGGGGGSGQINLTIDNLYVTQSVQNYAGDVPLVAGREGLVRVFVKATTANTLQPQVRVRLYNATTLLSTLTLNAAASSVPTTVSDATLASAWYATVSGSLIQPGLRILADVDPANAVGEASETDNAWPGSGAPATMNVRTVPTLSVRFVPIKQSNDLTGNVTTANTAAFLNDMRRMYPLATIDAEVRAPYTSNSGIVESNDANGAWSAVLSEINALHVVDGSTRNYYGVVKTSYSSGVAGIGYLGAPTAIGWDHLPSGADVMAHELGHNWGRYHAPCGGAGYPDPSYPYAGGSIGVSGYDLTMGVFKAPSMADLMGYCVPNWVSDYTYKGILNYRATHPMVATAARARVPEPGLLVWGRVARGELVLEPAFEIVAPAFLPARSGPHRIEALADDGTPLFSYAFAGEAVDHRAEDRHFAFVVPLSVLSGRTIGTLRLSSGGRVSESRSSLASVRALDDSSSVPRVRRAAANVARVSWTSAGVRGVLVRDAASGDILTIARDGGGSLQLGRGDVELVVSDGVRSRTRRVILR